MKKKERQRVDAALAGSEEKYREIFDATSEAMLLYDIEEGALSEVNQALVSISGFSRNELLGMDVGELSAEESPCSKEALKELFSKAVHEDPLSFEWLFKRKNGEHYWADCNLKQSRVEGKSVVIMAVRDINGRTVRGGDPADQQL